MAKPKTLSRVPMPQGAINQHTLSEKQRLFVDARVKGMNVIQAAQAAGYSNPEIQGYQVEKSPFVVAALEVEWKKAEKVSEMTKKKVMDGMLHAIDQAKLLADPTAQISGWREIAKMCGYYEPQRVQVEVSVSAKRLFSQFETLSDEELLKLAEQEILDGDELITESGQGQEALEYSEGTEESPGETEDYTDFTEIESPKES
jgi:phage terminase small subunit